MYIPRAKAILLWSVCRSQLPLLVPSLNFCNIGGTEEMATSIRNPHITVVL